MVEEFQRWMRFYGKSSGIFQLEKGNFLNEKYRETINSATIIFVNNFAFGPHVDHQVIIYTLHIHVLIHLKHGNVSHCGFTFHIL